MVQPLPRWKLCASSPSGSSTVDPPGREAPWRKPPEQLGHIWILPRMDGSTMIFNGAGLVDLDVLKVMFLHL